MSFSLLLQAREQVKQRLTLEPAAGFKGAFSRYVRALEPSGEPKEEAFEEMWQALRGALIYELQKRSLWHCPPSYLGIFGWKAWRITEQGLGANESALEELLADCYSTIFVRRLQRLQAHLKVKPNIEGLVFLYLRNYLHDRQKYYDPLGYRIFQVLRSAVGEAVATCKLSLAGGSSRIRNDSILTTGRGADTPSREAAAELSAIIKAWNQDLLPDLITATGARRRQLIKRLTTRLLELRACGVSTFRFGDLLDAVKNDVRVRWAALYDQQEGERGVGASEDVGALIRLVQPNRQCEEIQSFQRLSSCVRERLGASVKSARDRRHLQNLWIFLCTYAGDKGPEALPSNRRLSSLLDIPRERFPGLYRTLGELVRECLASRYPPTGACGENLLAPSSGRTR